jgi:hypothetical protein
MMNLYALAERLKMTYEEVEQISLSEYHGWLAYFKLQQEQVNAANANQNKSFRPNR